MLIREASPDDLPGLLALYSKLHDEDCTQSDSAQTIWQRILQDPGQHVLLGTEDGKIISSCVLVIAQNLTRGCRPWAVIENVITDKEYRKKGCATAVLDRAKEIAVRENCYKIMLMTGSKEESTLRFYEQAGYNRADKTAFILWLW